MLITFGLPSSYLAAKAALVIHSLVQALPCENREFYLGHVEPTAMFRSVMYLQLIRQAFRLRRLERLIQTARRVGVELIHYQHDNFSVWIVNIYQVLDHAGEVSLCPLVSDLHTSLPGERLKRHEEVGGSVSPVLAIDPPRAPRLRRQRFSYIGQQLLGRFVQTDLRSLGIVRSLIDIQHVLHPPNELGVGMGRNAPDLSQPRLERIFLSV